MFIELSEFLDCPGDHDRVHLVVATGVMQDRDIVHGTIGCPVCEAEFVIEHAVARFGARPDVRPADDEPPPPDDIQAVLELTGPGGFVVLIGSGARLGRGLAEVLPGVHFVAVNAPPDVGPGPHISLLEGPRGVPLVAGMARGVVVGGELAGPAWAADAARVLLPGRRVVLLTETPETVPETVERLAAGRGMWVGERMRG